MEKNTPWFLHVDLDAFFASVEQLDNPEYKGKPIIVGGKPEDRRSVVSTASYEARKYGVHSAMPTFQAYKLCPQGIYVYPRMKRYAELSYQIMTIFKDYSPDVIQMSIDEAFIDLTGTEKLFGPPEETAMKIKAHVKQYTGLTVSIGLASTKYLAKIASGFSKPDGFYFVKPGTEQEFMLNLPLEKVWGVGEKTLNSLKKSGIRTTRDIYDKPYDSLEFLFGKNTATFLFNVVRGIDTVNFGHEAKKHSLSSESTYSYDITDVYTAETQLLNLCYDVVFRLIRENKFSRTAFLKIRYDDFSTVSIQETVERNILTVDSFFEIIKRLFNKKWEVGRGIRLLGVGFDNIEKEDRPYQQDLFETGSEKKQAVEKAIINLTKKHPEVKIQKARMMNKTKVLAFFILSLFSLKNLTKLSAAKPKSSNMTGAGVLLSENFIEPSAEEEKESLFNWEVDDSNVELLFSGYWQANFSNTLNTSFGNNTGFKLSLGLPVFTQEVDLSTWIFLNKTWYFEAAFADNFEKNTIAMGYLGNGILKSARLANRGIKMPQFYSANFFGYGLSGGNNQAPGITLHFSDIESSRWSGDFLLRYDMTKTNSATFYGKNSVTDIKIKPENYVYGKFFIFPETCSEEISNIKNVYIENKNGDFKDNNGKKYIKLSQTEYIIQRSTNQLIISSNAYSKRQDENIPNILVTFSTEAERNKIINATGTFQDPNSFAGKIQEYFNTYRDLPLDLTEYSYNLEREINKEPAVVIQNSTHFSPYLCANTYDCGITSNSDLLIQSGTSEKPASEYFIEQLETDLSSSTQDFLFDNHLYAQVGNTNVGDSSLQNPANRYPFGDTNAEVYLNIAGNNDYEIVVRNYSPISEFHIGTEAIEGTIQVYINNILETNAHYNPETGNVDFARNINDTDKIYIVWQEDSSDYTGGALAAGTGLYFYITPNLTMDFAITTSWPLNFFENYATPDSPMSGFAAISAGINYNTENLTLSQKTAVALKSDNTSQNLFVLMQNNFIPVTYYLGNNDGYKTEIENFFTIDSSLELKEEANKTVISHGGINDSRITGYKIPLTWNFTQAESNLSWAAVDIHLDKSASLKTASRLELALEPQLPSAASVGKYQVYLQLGNTAGELDSDIFPTWKLTGFEDPNIVSPLDLSSSTIQTVIISLTESQRAKLPESCDARLIVTYNSTESDSSENLTGTIYFGPYEPKVQSLFVQSPQNINATAYVQKAINAPSAKMAKISENYATKLSWTTLDTSISATTENKIIASSYFKSSDFTNYENINIEIDSTKSGPLKILLQNEERDAVTLILPQIEKCFQILSDKEQEPLYHTLTINIHSNKVLIDGTALPVELYSLEINKQIVPNKIVFEINCESDNALIEQGAFYIGNIYYTNSSPYLSAENYLYASYKTTEPIAKIGDFVLLEDGNISVSSTQSSEISGNINAGITVANIHIQGDYDTHNIAGHNISTQNDLFGLLSFGESYRFNAQDESLNKVDRLALSFQNKFLPLKMKVQTVGKADSSSRSQEVVADGGVEAVIGVTKLGILTEANINQKLNARKNQIEVFNTSNYFDGWYDISSLQFSAGHEKASSRNQNYSSKIYIQLPYFSLKPELQYNLETVYQNINQSNITDNTTLALLQPFTIKNNGFSFNIKRYGGGVDFIDFGGNYISDFDAISSSFNKRSWIYSAIPFYDLFDPNLKEKVLATAMLDFSDSTNYGSVYEVLWKRKLSNTIKDLFIPSGANLSFAREIKAGVNVSDLYQLKLVLSNTALNCLGSQSSLKKFLWYEQDEFISNFTGIIKIPVDYSEKPTFTLSAYEQALFYISKEASLKTGFDVLIETNLNWNTKATFIWTRPGEYSILSEIVSRLSKTFTTDDFTILRKEIANISIGQNTKLFRQQYDFTHNTDFKFKKYYTINTGIGVSFISTQNTASNAGINLNVGGKIEF